MTNHLILDKNRNTCAKYAYDAWGKCKILIDVDNIGSINPFRYRGYYMDSETGWYYLQTRYYDPAIRRFINADDYELYPQLSGNMGELNLYSYCNNNPVMYTDGTGELIDPISLTIYGVIAIIGFIIAVGTIAYVESQTHFIKNIANDFTTGISNLWDYLFNTEEGDRGKGGETYPGEKKKGLPTWKEKDMFRLDFSGGSFAYPHR